MVARPIGNFTSSGDYMYQTMRCNVDLLKIIQLGITLSDANGNHPSDICTWQFNFHFSLKCVISMLTIPLLEEKPNHLVFNYFMYS